MKDPLPGRVRLGVFEVDLRVGELREGERSVLLQEQPFRILRMLIERGAELVTREEIKKKFWPNDTVVEFDHSINAAIGKLRRALDDSADDPRYIETIPRRGYRLIVPVEWVVSAENCPAEALPQVANNGAIALPKPPDSGTLGGRTVSHYRVLDIIGGGGMGVVYRAEDLKLGRRVALKFLPEELGTDPQALARFDREARAVSSLDHPNICTIHEFGEHEGRPFIVMQLLQGQTLRDRLAANEHPLPLEELLDVAIQVSDGLRAAHERGIIHRDVKPANIFITDKGVCKVLDFGVAKLLEIGDEMELALQPGTAPAVLPLASGVVHLTRTGLGLGTAGYMSPEQVRGEKLDARTDLFSLGLVLYEMATRQRAFTGDTAAVVQDAIVNRTPAPPRELNPAITPELEAVINKALEKDREQRYQTAADLGSELQRLKSDTESGRAVAPDEGRDRWPLWLAGSLAALLAGLAVAWFFGRRVEPPREVTKRQLTANPVGDRVTGAAISPDGKYVAYGDQTGLYLRTIDSGETHPVNLPAWIRSHIFGLSWFPGGGKLLAVVNGPKGGNDIWVITVLGEAEPRLLYQHAWAPAISPDGRMIAFTGEGGGKTTRGLWIGTTNGEPPRKLVAAEEPEVMFSPVWSPDGRWIAYGRAWKTTQGSWSHAVEASPVSGGPAKTLVAESSLPKSSTLIAGTFAEGWSPDWRLVFSVAEGSGFRPQTRYSLWQVRVDSGTGELASDPERVTQWSDYWPYNLTITADGKRLAFMENHTWDDVYVGELGPGGNSMTEPRRLTLDDRGSDSSAWTPDGQAILFDSERNGRSEIFRQGLNENVAEVIVSGTGDVYGGKMSPDGSWFLYRESESTSAHDGTSTPSIRLMRRAIARGSPEKVLELAKEDDFSCSSNPKSDPPCVLSHREGKDLVFHALDPARGKGRQLGKIEVVSESWLIGWGVSPDGSTLALVDLYKYKGEIELLSLADGTWREFSPKLGDQTLYQLTWTIDGKGFFVASIARGSPDVLHITLAGQVQPLLHHESYQNQLLGDPLASPDGKHLAFATQTWDSNVWMIDNF